MAELVSTVAAPVWRRQLQRITTVYSLGWLLAANLVGLWLALLLVWPGLGAGLGEWTYGRWMPLHMDWQLYGWCALPLVGLLLSAYLAPRYGSGAGDLHVGFLCWSLALLLGGWFSLQGEVSGKLFLNWRGAARVSFPVAQLVLVAVLGMGLWGAWRRANAGARELGLKLAGLLVLAASPVALFITAGREVYPPIDPTSGGATGHSLLASTLGIILIFGLLPWLLRVAPRAGRTQRWQVFAGAYLMSGLVWAVIEHGNASNESLNQVLGLAVLLLWVPLVVWYHQSFEWPVGLRLWRIAFFAWWGLLTVDGFVTFLPGVLDLLKFTNALVAHAHLAMAGMLGALNMLILGSLGPTREGDPWLDRASFWCWQLGTLTYVVVMTVQGVREGQAPFVLWGVNGLTQALYLVRVGAGLAMLLASVRWCWLAAGMWRRQKPSEFQASFLNSQSPSVLESASNYQNVQTKG